MPDPYEELHQPTHVGNLGRDPAVEVMTWPVEPSVDDFLLSDLTDAINQANRYMLDAARFNGVALCNQQIPSRGVE